MNQELLGRPIVRKMHKVGIIQGDHETWDFSNLELSGLPDDLIQYLSKENVMDLLDDGEDPFSGILDLSGNQLTQLPQNLYLRDLEGLDLSNNKLTQLPELSIDQLTYLNLSHNQFQAIPFNFIAQAYNLLEFKIEHNLIDELKISEISSLLEIHHVSIDDNPLGVNFYEKVQAAIRIGLLDPDVAAFSKFKFKEHVGDPKENFKRHIVSRFDEEFIRNKSNYIAKYFEILSFRRLTYFENIEADHYYDKMFVPPDSKLLWDMFETKINNFKDVQLMRSDAANFMYILLKNKARINEFNDFIIDLFGQSLVK